MVPFFTYNQYGLKGSRITPALKQKMRQNGKITVSNTGKNAAL